MSTEKGTEDRRDGRPPDPIAELLHRAGALFNRIAGPNSAIGVYNGVSIARINQDIKVPRVLLIDQNGEKQGIMPTSAALEAAEEAGLDLVEVSPTADPPVCKILDYGKYRFQEQKKKAEARKKQKVVEIKEIKMRPNIDTHDYDVKMKAIKRFFDDGDKVKVTLRFRGREMAHQELGMKLLDQVKGDTVEIAKVESEPRLEGRQMTMVLAPR